MSGQEPLVYELSFIEATAMPAYPDAEYRVYLERDEDWPKAGERWAPLYFHKNLGGIERMREVVVERVVQLSGHTWGLEAHWVDEECEPLYVAALAGSAAIRGRLKLRRRG